MFDDFIFIFLFYGGVWFKLEFIAVPYKDK